MVVDACVGRHKLRQEEMYKQPNIVWVEVSMALGSTRMLQCSCIWVVYSALYMDEVEIYGFLGLHNKIFLAKYLGLSYPRRLRGGFFLVQWRCF